MWDKKLKFLSTFSHFRFWLSPKKSLFSKLHRQQEAFDWEPNGRFWLVVTKKKQFEGQDFTLSIAGFGRIRKSEFHSKDRSIWLCNQVCLLKCKGLDGHSDGTNQIWVDLVQNDLEYRDIIHIIKTILGIIRV